MRIIKTEIKAYTFDELSEDAKDKVIQEWESSDLSSYDWWQSTYEDAEQVGIKITAFSIYVYCKGLFIDSAEETAHKIIDNHGEMCETYKTATQYLKERDEVIETAKKNEDGEFDDVGDLDNILDELDSEFLKSILEDYRIILDKEYEYLTSREAIIETIQANEYEFTEDGKMI